MIAFSSGCIEAPQMMAAIVSWHPCLARSPSADISRAMFCIPFANHLFPGFKRTFRVVSIHFRGLAVGDILCYSNGEKAPEYLQAGNLTLNFDFDYAAWTWWEIRRIKESMRFWEIENRVSDGNTDLVGRSQSGIWQFNHPKPREDWHL
jgi:hypothetical protein